MRVSNYEISQRASRKAFAKITMLKIEIDKLKDDLKNGLTGGITIEELINVYEGTKGDYDITDVPRPFCFYGYSKLAGEAFIPSNGLVLRTSFLPRGYWGEDALTKVFTDVYTSKDWVDIIAGKIIDKLGDTGVYNVGTERKSLKDLAVQEYPEVEDLDLNILDFGFNYPKDSSMRVDT